MVRYAILGYGRSGRSAYRYLSALPDAEVTVYVKQEEYARLSGGEANVAFVAGYENLSADILVRSPGIRPDAAYIRRAVAHGACLTSETALFLSRCRAPVSAVTGSDGKTTTATLAARMLEAAGHTVHLGGNIGTPLLDRVADIRPTDRVVLELSSFQLTDMAPVLAGAAVTNLTENHLDWHTDMREYADAKRNILMHAARRVQNARAPLAPEYAGLTFSAYVAGANYHRTDGYLMHGDERLVAVSDVKLIGEYNLENILCAAALTGADAASVRQVAATFSGIAHRLEYCGCVNGVECYNSSIDTTPARTTATLAALPRGVTVMVGGAGKNLSWEPLVRALCERAAAVVFTGDTGKAVQAELEDFIRGSRTPTPTEKDMGAPLRLAPAHVYVRDFDEAFAAALAMTPCGGTLVLSPAATSFDFFQSYTARGEAFRALVARYQTP